VADARAQEGRLALSAPAAFLVGPEAAASICPFLGALDDVGVLGDAIPAYSERNRCTAFGPWLPQGQLQQELVCLTVAHQTCPRYTRGVRYGPSGPRRSATAGSLRSGLLVLGLAAVAVLVLGVALVLGQGLISGPLAGLIGGTSSTPTPSAIASPTATVEPTATPTLQATPSPTAAPTPAPTPRPTAKPTPAFRNYTVQSGDTLYGIAKKFGVTVASIRALNPSVKDTDIIHVGQVLKIPT
jgi:LysM repeat protein